MRAESEAKIMDQLGEARAYHLKRALECIKPDMQVNFAAHVDRYRSSPSCVNAHPFPKSYSECTLRQYPRNSAKFTEIVNVCAAASDRFAEYEGVFLKHGVNLLSVQMLHTLKQLGAMQTKVCKDVKHWLLTGEAPKDISAGDECEQIMQPLTRVLLKIHGNLTAICAAAADADVAGVFPTVGLSACCNPDDLKLAKNRFAMLPETTDTFSKEAESMNVDVRRKRDLDKIVGVRVRLVQSFIRSIHRPVAGIRAGPRAAGAHKRAARGRRCLDQEVRRRRGRRGRKRR